MGTETGAKRIVAGVLLGIAAIFALILGLTQFGCEESTLPEIVVQPKQVEIPSDCPAATWDESAAKCRETGTGLFIIAECCGRKP